MRILIALGITLRTPGVLGLQVGNYYTKLHLPFCIELRHLQLANSYGEVCTIAVLACNTMYPLKYSALRAVRNVRCCYCHRLTLGRDADRQGFAPVTVNTDKLAAAFQPVTLRTSETGF